MRARRPRFEALRIPFSVKPLNAISPQQRAKFTIDQDGTSIHWPESDVELDLEGFRRLIDPVRTERAKQHELAHDVEFGRALAALRHSAGIRQTDIEGLSLRHVGRIEAGAVSVRVQSHILPTLTDVPKTSSRVRLLVSWFRISEEADAEKQRGRVRRERGGELVPALPQVVQSPPKLQT